MSVAEHMMSRPAGLEPYISTLATTSCIQHYNLTLVSNTVHAFCGSLYEVEITGYLLLLFSPLPPMQGKVPLQDTPVGDNLYQ